MARKLIQIFFSWLQGPVGRQILSTIAQYRCLSIAMDGNALRVYYQGCKVLLIKFNEKTGTLLLEPLATEYLKSSEPDLEAIIQSGITPANLQKYLDAVIGLISRRDNKRQEERIRQEITCVNNVGREANDTDFFIVDQEYGVTVGGKTSKFDLVAIKWLSNPTARKCFTQSNLEIVIFELKLGKNAVGGTTEAKGGSADLKQHMSDFNNFHSDTIQLEEFKKDILEMFIQQSCLAGFFSSKIKGLKHVRKLLGNNKAIKELADRISVKFGFILVDYKQESTVLAEQISTFEDDFLFATSSFMGYGLYDRCIINRQQLIERLK